LLGKTTAMPSGTICLLDEESVMKQVELCCAAAMALGIFCAGCAMPSMPSLPKLPPMSSMPSVSLSGSSYIAAADETAAVKSIELAWPDGRGMGAFVSVIDPQEEPARAAQIHYRVDVIFDSGSHTVLTQDGSVALAVGQRVVLRDGRALPTDRTDVPHLAPVPHF
jgi:hypothetical protein